VERSWQRLNQSKKKVVYFIRGNKSHRYRWGNSRILYIGRTERNAKRPFESLEARAESLLSEYGMKTLDVVYIEARGRKRLDVSDRLEKASLYYFRQTFGDVPKANVAGSRHLELSEREKRLFNPGRIIDVLKRIGQTE
jgi:hypothetical protein